MKFRWTVAPQQPLLTGQLANALKISPLLAQCLVNRALANRTHREFLQPRLKNLADPFLLPNMARQLIACFRRANARNPRHFGDYDVDGVTSTLCSLKFPTTRLAANCYLPHRVDEGYGLSQTAWKIA